MKILIEATSKEQPLQDVAKSSAKNGKRLDGLEFNTSLKDSGDVKVSALIDGNIISGSFDRDELVATLEAIKHSPTHLELGL